MKKDMKKSKETNEETSRQKNGAIPQRKQIAMGSKSQAKNLGKVKNCK